MSNLHEETPFRARLPLPTLPIATDTRCFEIEIPNDPHLVGAFVGAINMLSVWTYWQRSENHAAIEAANVFKQILHTLEEQDCMGCKHTNPVFQDNLASGETRELEITVEAGEFQILPMKLLPNQSISILDMVGQWRDSQYHPEADCASNWETPLGIMIHAAGSTVAETFETDIMPEVPHMKLIMRVNSCDTLSYHDLDDPIVFTVPPSAEPDGVFVEFLGNMPIDGSNEVTAGFLGYGMVCFKVIVSDPNLCPQVFIDFEDASLPLFIGADGSVVNTSPIGEGKAYRRDSVSLTSTQAKITIPLDDCSVRDIAFTIYEIKTGTSGDLALVWTAYDPDDVFIESDLEVYEVPDQESQPFTLTFSPILQHVGKLELRWTINCGSQGDTSDWYIDNVFVN